MPAVRDQDDVARADLGGDVDGASTVVPVYLAELAPYEIRGSLAGRNEVMIVSGMLAAFVVNAVSATFGESSTVFGASGSQSLPCRPSHCSSACFACLNHHGWLVSKGRQEDALNVLKTIRSVDRVEAEVEEVRHLGNEYKETTRWSVLAVLKNKWPLRLILVGIGIGVAQQLTGINSILYYGQSVLIKAGFNSNAALIANSAPEVISVLGSLIALRLMETMNRRTTFMLGYGLTTACRFLIGIASVTLPIGNPACPFVLLFLIVAFVGSMNTFLNVATWVTLSEIFPLHIRGFAIGISVFCLWIANAFFGLYLPSIDAAVGITGTFFMFGAVGIAALIFVYTQMPETRGRTLEALEEDVTTGAIYQVHKKERPPPRRTARGHGLQGPSRRREAIATVGTLYNGRSGLLVPR